MIRASKVLLPIDDLKLRLSTCSWCPQWTEEFRFHSTRRWRFDLCWPQEKIAMECEGGTWIAGRHSRGGGYESDCEKYIEALLLGWIVLRVTPRQIQEGKAEEWLKKVFKRKEIESEALGNSL